MRFHFTTMKRFWSLLGCFVRPRTHFRDASLSFPLARHGYCHGSFQFSPRIFECFFVILVIRLNKVNSSQTSGIVEFCLLVCPFLFFSILSGFNNFCAYFWSYMIWSGSRLHFCQSPPGPHTSTVKLPLKFLRGREAVPILAN